MKGWYGEPTRHSLAARGFSTKYMRWEDMYTRLCIDEERENAGLKPRKRMEHSDIDYFCPVCNSRVPAPGEGIFYRCPYCEKVFEVYDMIVEATNYRFDVSESDNREYEEDLEYGSSVIKCVRYGDFVSADYVRGPEHISDIAFCPLCESVVYITKDWRGDNLIRCPVCHTKRSWRDYLVTYFPPRD
jgi:DNA-directed RNA polymerase subunit M/transcription elongation factor TFIIS